MNYKPFTIYNKRFLLLFIVSGLLFLSTPIGVDAQDNTEYRLLAPIPGVSTEEGGVPCVSKDDDGNIIMDENGNTIPCATAKSYIPGIIVLIIGIAGVLAVIKIIFGGILYMSTDAIGGKSEGKGHITDALWGLLLIVSAWIILNTINPDLVNLNLTIKGLEVGGAFETGLGRIPTREELDEEKARIGCPNCAAILPGAQIGTTEPKSPGAGCGRGTEFCYIDGELAGRLVELTGNIKDVYELSVRWQVTEMFPPTVNHSHPCHQYNPNSSVSAQCVDVALRSLLCANQTTCSPNTRLQNDARQVRIFTEEASRLGLKVVYEVPNNARRDALIAELVRQQASNISVISVNRPNFLEHFSVYLNSSVHTTNQ